MHIDHLTILRSPQNGNPLQLTDVVKSGDFVETGTLSDGENEWQIVGGIPRFVPNSGADSFSIQWGAHPEIMHELYSGYTVYKDRFDKETKWPGDLSDEMILEAGCGVGPFTGHALRTGATVVSFDLSTSVDTVRSMHEKNKRLLVIQASIYDLPFEAGTFDKAYCFGVLQHTPDPRKSFETLVKMIRPGGRVATDIYADVPLTWQHGMLRSKYAIRPYVEKMPPENLYKWIKRYVAIAYPIGRMLQRIPGGIPISQHMMIDHFEARMRGMDKKQYKEFAIVDIFDMLGAAYDQPATIEEFQSWHDQVGLKDVEVHYGYNGIEGRGCLPD